MVFDASSRRLRVCAIRAVILAAAAAHLAKGTTSATPLNTAIAEVRSTNPFIRALMAEAADRSRTFRRLVEAIERSDGIVYVESGVCGHGAQACLVMSVTPAAGYRILRILLNTHRHPWDLMESIGHELRHALEVLDDRSLISGADVYLFYARESGPLDHPFETAAAINAGTAVRREIESSYMAAR